ncbi:histidine phosphatase family protein [Acidisoma cellulosilytica]|uniref:Histidine phosphatase family protein n=1 Tax=Acidisoma cellulosilyticum TaxID=2802395 RepID=A0A963YZ13_9PROT|nr:histidine phosphatase family protein [Acidisoma cellulosilyticum]MCB8879763.1 histidine phosphatase family protein [Acidisoma cellulosilyticum]
MNKKISILHYSLVRHPAVSGGAGRCYGQLDLRLAAPKRDIPLLVSQLAPMRGAVIHTSPLHRCRLVAEALAADWGDAAQIDDRLIEMNFGTWEGLSWDDVPRHALDAWAADLHGFTPPQGESGNQLIARVSAFWAEIKAEGGRHVIITHGGPLKVLTALAEGQPVDLSRPPPSKGAVIHGTQSLSRD